MSISSISSSLMAVSQTSSSSRTSTGVQRPPRPPSEGGGGMMQAVQQAFSQLGINLPAPAKAAAGTQSSAAASTDAASAAQTVGQDMHKLMHDLFAALNQAQGQSTGDTASSSAGGVKASSGYGNLSSGLQDLIKQLDSTSSDPLAALKSDFQKILDDVQAKSGTTDSGSGTSAGSNPTLQSFLQNLLKNIGNQPQPSAAVGGVINTVS